MNHLNSPGSITWWSLWSFSWFVVCGRDHVKIFIVVIRKLIFNIPIAISCCVVFLRFGVNHKANCLIKFCKILLLLLLCCWWWERERKLICFCCSSVSFDFPDPEWKDVSEEGKQLCWSLGRHSRASLVVCSQRLY